MLVGSDQGPAMNAFYEHYRDSIRFGYRCFDRILLNGLIQPFQQPVRVVGFFDTYRRVYPVSRDVLRGAAEQSQAWVKEEVLRGKSRNRPTDGMHQSSRRQRVAVTNSSSPTSGSPSRIRSSSSSKPVSRRESCLQSATGRRTAGTFSRHSPEFISNNIFITRVPGTVPNKPVILDYSKLQVLNALSDEITFTV
jgi:hypothetical protein